MKLLMGCNNWGHTYSVGHRHLSGNIHYPLPGVLWTNLRYAVECSNEAEEDVIGNIHFYLDNVLLGSDKWEMCSLWVKQLVTLKKIF